MKSTGRRYNDDVNLWVTISWQEYTYNANGCELSFLWVINAGAFSGEFQRIEYERDEDCQIIKRTFWQQDLGNSSELLLVELEERTYLQDEISYENKIFASRETSEDLYIREEGTYHFNSFGNQVESVVVYYSEDPSDLDFIENRIVSIFDLNKNLTATFSYTRRSNDIDWSTFSHYTYENEYDEENRMINRTLYNSISHTDEFLRNDDYEYLCEYDLEPTKSSRRHSNGSMRTYDYFYEGPNECFEIEEALLGVEVFPNPSFGDVTIQSPILQSGNTQVLVFDMNGKLLLEKNEFRREEKTDLDLSDLPNGMYVVQLMNQEHFVQKKVMVMN